MLTLLNKTEIFENLSCRYGAMLSAYTLDVSFGRDKTALQIRYITAALVHYIPFEICHLQTRILLWIIMQVAMLLNVS